MRIPQPTLVAAVAVVTISMVATTIIGDLSEGLSIHIAPIVPAIFVLWSMFTGRPHGVSIGWYQQAAAIFLIAVVMWWAIFEVCRRLWNRARREPPLGRCRGWVSDGRQ